jgi:hypothetical protein
MKNKLLLAALAVFLVGGFTACKDDILDVRNVVDKINVAGVNAALTTSTTSTRYIIVSWDAVDDVRDYNVYYKRTDDKQINSGYSISIQAQNDYAYTSANGTASTNPDRNKWSVCIDVSNLVAKKTYTFGIETSPASYSNSVETDIVWSNEVTAP